MNCPDSAFQRKVHPGWKRGSTVKDKKAPNGSYPGPIGTLLYLKGLDKRPEQDAYGVALAKQLDQPCCPEETKEAQIDEVVLKRRSTIFTSFVSLSKVRAGCFHPTTPPQVPVTPKKCIKRIKIN